MSDVEDRIRGVLIDHFDTSKTVEIRNLGPRASQHQMRQRRRLVSGHCFQRVANDLRSAAPVFNHNQQTPRRNDASQPVVVEVIGHRADTMQFRLHDPKQHRRLTGDRITGLCNVLQIAAVSVFRSVFRSVFDRVFERAVRNTILYR